MVKYVFPGHTVGLSDSKAPFSSNLPRIGQSGLLIKFYWKTATLTCLHVIKDRTEKI